MKVLAMHPLPDGPPPWTQGYRHLDYAEEQVIWHALGELSGFAELWYRLIDLYLRGLYGITYVEDEEARVPWEARSQLLGLALGNSKVAFDAALAGYYSACFGLIRHLLESWEHIAYIRFVPKAAASWYEQPQESTAEREPPPSRRRRQLLRQKLKDPAIVGIVERLTEQMHKGAHPSGEGLAQTVDDEADRYELGATYRRGLALLALDAGILANSLLLEELAWLRPQDAGWLSEMVAIEDRRRELHKLHPPETHADPTPSAK
jgi:hypothetical protein